MIQWPSEVLAVDFQTILLAVLLIVACVISGYLRSKNDKSDDTSSVKNNVAKDVGGLIKCANCGASIASSVRYCPYCGMEKRSSGNVEIHHAEKVIIESRPSLLQHIISERERTKQERLEKEERENRRYLIAMLILMFGLGTFVVIMKLLYWK